MLEFNKYIKNRLEEFNVEKLERLKKVKFILLSKQNYIVWLFTLDYFLERKSSINNEIFNSNKDIIFND